jgi:oligoribonuclease (3'-5' exoribonuclease)
MKADSPFASVAPRGARRPRIEDPRFYLWFDTEFSTLDVERAWPLQVALMVTDTRLRRVCPPQEDVRAVIRLPRGAPLSPWVRRHLSDLLRRCRSKEAVSTEEADRRLAALVDHTVGRPRRKESLRPVLAGNSVHADWRIAQRFFPRLAARLNYRHLDVTALKLQWWARRHRDDEEEFVKENVAQIRRLFPEAVIGEIERHDAYYDVQASVAELAFYRRRLCRRGLFSD